MKEAVPIFSSYVTHIGIEDVAYGHLKHAPFLRRGTKDAFAA
jgi:hypothetical protein